jgi:hypothetical protein
MELGFKRYTMAHGMYTQGSGDWRLIVGVYVDDLIITSGDIDVLNNFKQEMQKVFKMSNVSPSSYYLGIEVHQEEKGITISQ